MTGTLCTSGQALTKAGVGVNTISGMLVVDQFIKEAEGVACGVARFDFVTNYTDISTIGKELLREITSNIAGIQLIQYDMDGYTSRIIAEDQVNILRDAKLMGLSILRDTKLLEFIKVK